MQTPVRRISFPWRGDYQTDRTLQLMREIVNNSMIEQPSVLETAVAIVRAVGGRDTYRQAEALRSWLEQHVEFLPDPAIDGDVLRTPAFVLEEIRRHGVARIDCDDAAMLSAALAKSVGMAARFVVMAFFRGAPFSHVMTEVETDRGWIRFDVTEPRGRELEPHRAMMLPV